METKKHLWRCGSQSIKKKRSSSKKDSDSKDQRIGDDHHSNLATSLIKFVKKKCSSFNVKKRKKLQSQPHQSQENKENHRRKPKKTAAKAKAKTKAKKSQLTLQDWIFESAADVSFGNSGEFHVFKQAKKIHPSIERNNNLDDGVGNQSGKKSYRSIDQMLDSISGGEEVAEEDSASPARLSSGETGKKRVRFRFPVVTKIIVLESSDPKE